MVFPQKLTLLLDVSETTTNGWRPPQSPSPLIPLSCETRGGCLRRGTEFHQWNQSKRCEVQQNCEKKHHNSHPTTASNVSTMWVCWKNLFWHETSNRFCEFCQWPFPCRMRSSHFWRIPPRRRWMGRCRATNGRSLSRPSMVQSLKEHLYQTPEAGVLEYPYFFVEQNADFDSNL